MNSFNIIFFVSIANYNFTFCLEMVKCSGYHPVSKSVSSKSGHSTFVLSTIDVHDYAQLPEKTSE